MIVDLFAGGGGASTGIEIALGRSPDVAVNHSRAVTPCSRGKEGRMTLYASFQRVYYGTHANVGARRARRAA